MDSSIGITGTTNGRNKNLTVSILPATSQDEDDYFSRPRRVQWGEDEVELIGADGDRRLGFPDFNDLESLGAETEPSVITDLGEYLYETSTSSLARTATALSRSITYDSSEGLLQERLIEAIEASRQSMVLLPRDQTGFIPRQQQVRILTETSVAEELLRIEKSLRKRFQFWSRPPSPRRIAGDASIICANVARHLSPRGNHERSKTFRKVFATLLLIGRPGAIRSFIDDGLCDADLPLRRSRTPGKKTISLHRKDAQGIGLKCFEGWKGTTLVQFERVQWKLVAPFFSRGEEDKAMHFPFPDEVILPFTYMKHAHSGAHGEVFKVRIHPEHHDFNKNKDTGAGEYFAVKRLFGTEKEFEQEVRMLKRLSHAHLVSLLATYQYGKNFHLIFPWAECNLRTYWEVKNPNPSHDIGTLLWMARQCEGIAEGLERVHHHDTSSGSSIILGSSKMMRAPWIPTSPGFFTTPDPITPGSPRLPRTTQHRMSRIVYGRHGDIKPTNLLWFPDPGDLNGRGTIKICDFGAGEFSKEVSSPSTSTSISHSPPYRPPEFDLPDSIINNSYDIWTLGCIYLEIITWFMGGWKLLEEFQSSRRLCSRGWCRTNAFFEVLRDPDSIEDSRPQEARLKPAVLECIQSLRDHPKYSTFFAKFLGMIQTSMLIVEPHRISCHHIYLDLGKWIENCDEDAAWALGPFYSVVL